MEKLIFICFDGLSWNIIKDLIADGQLNNIKEIINTGVSGIMSAEPPLLSPQIWASIFTGKKEEKHGIIDFYSVKEDIKSNQIWDVLNNNGFKIGIYRPLSALALKKYDDFFVPSIHSFEKEAYPKNLTFIHELDHKARTNEISLYLIIKTFWKLIKLRFPLKDFVNITITRLFLGNKRNFKEYLSKIKGIEFRIHTNVFFKLIKKYKPQFSLIYENSCDTLSHIFWKDYEDKIKFSEIIPKIYKKMDKFIGQIKKYAKKNNIHLLIVSDHGFTGIPEVTIKDSTKNLKISNLLKELKLENDVYGIQLGLISVFRLKKNASISFEEFKNIFESIECNGEKMFKINESDKRLIVKIKYFIGNEKDLKVKLNKEKILDIHSIIDFNSKITGEHNSKYGVFIIKGNKIKKGEKIDEIKPYDITPTILTLLGVPIPSETDGKVLKDIFIREPKISFYREIDKKIKEESTLSKDEEEIIKERLRSLGYL